MSKAQPQQVTPNNRLASQALAQLQAGNPQLALHTCELVLIQDSTHTQSLHVAGMAHKQLGDLQKAIALMRQSVAAVRPAPEHIYYLATTLMQMGKSQEALSWYERLAAMRQDGAAWNDLGVMLMQMGRHSDAVLPLKLAVKMERRRAEWWANYGAAQMHAGDLPGAERSLRKSLDLELGNENAQLNLAVLLGGQGRPTEALELYYDLIARGLHLGMALSNCANLEAGLGRYDIAEPMYRRSLEVRPTAVATWDNWLYCLLHAQKSNPEHLIVAQHSYSTYFEAPLAAKRMVHCNDLNPNRCLKVGFVSADLRDHVVASFLEPLLEQLRQLPGLQLHAYANIGLLDAVSGRLRQHFASWSMVSGISDDDLAVKIRKDGIDILVDLSGHTASNRLLVFARKPAPLQVSWLGSPGSTGLVSMDYYFGDHHFLPAGKMDDLFSEKIVRLPSSFVFQPAKDAPPVNQLPAFGNGYVTLGSFNHLRKLNRDVIALWAKLMRALPLSRILVGGMPQDTSDADIRDWFRHEGIEESRLRFHSVCPLPEYLALHNAVDIHLDTFPYNGGTTSLHSAWMGLPTLTLCGKLPSSRSGASIMGHLGLPNFVAQTQDEFVERGIYWAEHLTELATLRQGMRDQFRESMLSNPEAVANGIDTAFRTMWRNWCVGNEPVSFAIAPNMPHN